MNIQETIEKYSKSAVEIGLKTYDRDLDFSDKSIDIADEILDGYHNRFISANKDDIIKEHVNTYACIFGIYVGEVLIRNYANGYTWQDTEYGLALVKNEKNNINPIAKAYKQIVNGKEAGDDIKSFFNISIQIMQGKFSFPNRGRL